MLAQDGRAMLLPEPWRDYGRQRGWREQQHDIEDWELDRTGSDTRVEAAMIYHQQAIRARLLDAARPRRSQSSCVLGKREEIRRAARMRSGTGKPLEDETRAVIRGRAGPVTGQARGTAGWQWFVACRCSAIDRRRAAFCRFGVGYGT